MAINKREAALKSAFTAELRRQLPDFICLLLTTRGAPDRAIVGNKQTTYWEFKHATPAFASPGLQELICMRLDRAAYCRYVFWWETASGRQTLIATPQAVHERIGWGFAVEYSVQGFDHKWLVEHIRQVHHA